MRAGLSTIQQTLTPEASTVLNHSISEASRRNHGQTTPLHVAATLLSSPSGYLRQACIRSHPNSSHPLQCRALELCFSVALERLPTAQNMPQGTEPPISNALMAALKRAQAHQRRGCPEQQQQPLLAVKVELEQLIISILDDPSVSRVMREASFSSPAVKATIEQSLTQTSSSSHQMTHQSNNVSLSTFASMSGGPRIISNPVPGQVNRNMYLNPKLQGGGQFGNLAIQKSEDVQRVMEILLRSKKRNPILVGEGEPESVVKELLGKIEKGELGEGVLKNVQVVHMEKEISFLSDKNEIPNKIKELGGVIESKISSTGGVILDLGDLKWLVEQQQPPMVSEIGKLAVAEMGKLIARFRDDNTSNRLWLIGTATCETYLRCQVYHSTMENDWDLQAVPIASRSPHPGIFPRLGNERILGSSLDTLKSFTGPVPALLPRRGPENLNPRLRTSCCPQCKEKYEQELAKLASEFENSSSEANKSESPKPQLPQWLQSAKLKSDSKATALSQKEDQGLLQQKTQELQKKWNDTCLQLHPNFQSNVGPHRTGPPVLSMPGLYNPNPNLLLRQPLQPKLVPNRSLGVSLQLNTTQMASQPQEKPASPPGSPVRTDLVLGQKPAEKTLEDQAKDFLSCISSVPDKFASALDADTFKRLLKGLMEKAWWQQDASSSVASAVSRCRLGNGKPRGGAPKGDIWLLFTGPDRYAKRKMASVLAEQFCGNSPIMICLGSRRDDEESDLGFRGKTAVDRIAEAVRRNPLSVIMLEDIDEANSIVRLNIKRAMDRGRLTDSHGREISLGNVIFILTGNWSTMSPESYRNEYLMEENKLVSLASSDWQLRLTIGERGVKRRASWLHDEDRPRKELNLGLSFDLNEAADFEDYRTDGSHNSSDLTVEHGDEPRRFSVTSVPHELVSSVDDTIPFKPIEFLFARREIKKTISKKLSMVVDDDKVLIEVEDDIVDRILGGLWRGRTSLEQWVEKVLGPSFEKIQPRLSSSNENENVIVRLQLEQLHTDSNSHNNGECLPSKVTIVADGQ
ncbi:protein SUPPRESSOR OF MAX2 1-like [Lycium barbarum]|uniref:protein SUPPRESSOR OF MAX2 1-like n=1 Tax=Lycium barbarum TaxID=112863 RepID=UPI00293E9523|nr:protein SUPPRESSOR OF MAX2 1-like [Lycium barbarum]